MYEKINDPEKIRDKLKKELNDHIIELEKMIRNYGSFNIIANSVARNHFKTNRDNDDEGLKVTIPEYIALLCLKFPFSVGYRELTNMRDVPKDLHEINELTKKIISNYSFLHLQKFKIMNKDGELSELEHLAQTISSEELLVRNPTFESFHWDLLEELYDKYEGFFKNELGFTVKEAIRICLTIGDYIEESFLESVDRCKKSIAEMTDEIMAYKYRKKIPKNFYPPEILERFKSWPDQYIKKDFEESMMTYQMVTMGDTLSFTAQEIAEMEILDVVSVEKFLDRLSLNFGDINPDFSKPEIIHPLKDRPLIKHNGKYLSPSISLLDFSLDKLFYDSVNKNFKYGKKHKDHRHAYLLEKGLGYLSETLKTDKVYKNLSYPNGEMDGLIFCGDNILFIEAKAHKFSDRAKKGLIDRIEKHLSEVIKVSYNQALRTYDYLFGKKDVHFTDKAGKKIVLDCSIYQNAYFISLTLDDFNAISCNLKVNNSLGLFNNDAFPWITSLYNLRAVCEHMEGPSYFIQYLHRRKEFFKYKKFLIQDELDILGYYLKRNLRFDDIIEQRYDKSNIIYLETMSGEFNKYYAYLQGESKRPVSKMTHYSNPTIKTIVKKLEDYKSNNGIDAAVQLLELGSSAKKEFIEYIKRIKKKFNKDNYNHDFRITGNDVNDKKWMFSYWVGPDNIEFENYFESWINKKFSEEPTNNYIAILDTGKKDFNISKIIHLKKDNRF